MSGQPNRGGGDTAAAVGFTVAAAAVAGFAGVLIAALAVGIERSWSGRGGGPSQRRAARRDRYADHWAWLIQDRARRAAFRQRRQDWWRAGAHGDPPKGPGLAARVGSWFRRRWARGYVGVRDFVDGFVAGWRAADEARRGGARPGEVARTRPPHPTGPAREDTSQPGPSPTPQEGDGQQDQPSRPSPQPDKGDTMTQPTSPQPAPSAAPQGDSNAAVMAAHLQQIETRQTRISELVDLLAAERAGVETEVAAAAEFAESTGQTAETRQALDAATAVTAQLGEQIGGVSDSATEAADQLAAARQGLRVVEEAEDALTSAGADGRAVAPAGAAA